MQNKTPRATGVVPKPYDPRDWSFADAPVTQPVVIPDNFIFNVYDQNQVGNCGPEMITFKSNFLFPGMVNSPRYTSEQVRLRDGLPVTYGSHLRTNYQAAQTAGFIPLVLMPDDTADLTEQEYYNPSNITRSLAIMGMSHRINWYAFKTTPYTFESIQQDLDLFGMLECHIHLGTGFFTPSWKPQDIFPLKLGTYVDDHFIQLIRPDIARLGGIVEPNPNFIYFVTQWGRNYGINGIGWFDASYLPQIVDIGASGL